MKRRGWIIAGIIVVVLAALAGYGAVDLFEKVEEEVIEPPAGEARTNPFLALERFMSADGWQVETVLTQSEPQGTDTLSIIAGDTSNFGPAQIVIWQQWVNDGGHLVITEPPASVRRKGDMVDAFGFGEPPEIETLEEDAADADAGDSEESASADDEQGKQGETDAADANTTADAIAEAADEAADDVEDEDFPMWGEAATTREGTVVMTMVADCPSSRLAADTEVIDRVWRGKGDCMVAVSRPMGDGRVTVVPDLSMFSNRRIGKFQHARIAHDLFWQTSGKNGQDARISLYGKRVSWMGYLWSLFWPTSFALLLVLLFAVMGGLRRFGPLVAPVQTARRRRTEHVVAIGRFMWKHSAGDTLLAAAQESLIQAVARGRAPSKMKRSEKAKWLAERTGITIDEARRIMAEHAPENPKQFADLIKQIEDLRRR